VKKRWQTKTLGEVAEVIAGQSPEGSFYNTSGDGLPFYQGKKEFGEKGIGAPTTWTSQITKVALEGDVLMSVRAPVGPVNFATQKSCIGRGLAAIRNGKDLDRNFLFYFLLSKQEEINGTEGAVFASINKNDIKSIKIVVPPTSEQQRIVGILDETFDGIATAKTNAEMNLQNARALFESHLNSVFTQSGEWWPNFRLGDMVERLTNGYVGPTRNIYCENGVPYLLARHVKKNRLTFDGKTIISSAFNAKNRKSILKAGDVLLVQSGHIGHSAVVPPEHAGHNCHAMIVISPIPGKLVGMFLSRYFESPRMQLYFESIRTGSTIKHLNCGDVREIKVPVPSRIEQNRVVCELEHLSQETQRLATLYEHKLDALEVLKKSLLYQAFGGQL